MRYEFQVTCDGVLWGQPKDGVNHLVLTEDEALRVANYAHHETRGEFAKIERRRIVDGTPMKWEDY